MTLPITSLYAGIITIVVLVLSARAGWFRGSTGISIGDGGNVKLHERVRQHQNAMEYVPLALILLALLESNGAGSTLLHGLGIALVIARIAHPLGLKADNIQHPLRTLGAAGTALMMLVAAVLVLWQVVQQLS